MGTRRMLSRLSSKELSEMAEDGVQQAQYFLGQRSTASDTEEDLQQAAMRLRSAMEHSGYELNAPQRRTDCGKYKKLAQKELCRVLGDLMEKHGAKNNDFSRLDEQGKQYLFQTLEIGDAHVGLNVALAFLDEKIDFVDGQTADVKENKQRALSLLSDAIEQNVTPRCDNLNDFCGGDPEIIAAYGEGLVRLHYFGEYSWPHGSSDAWSPTNGPTAHEDGFKMIEEAGDLRVHPFDGYKAAIGVLKRLEARANGLTKHFSSQSKQAFAEVQDDFMRRISQARGALQFSKEASDDMRRDQNAM